MSLFDVACAGRAWLHFLTCRLRRLRPAWVALSLYGTFPEWTKPQLPLPFPFNRLWRPRSEPSLAEIRETSEILASDPRVQGVVLRLDMFRADLSAAYSLRENVRLLREKGKRVVAWVPQATLPAYYLASACDAVLLPRSGRLLALGLRIEATFLKDLLTSVGILADLEAIGEYKVAPDVFRRVEMNSPHREMLEAILDSALDEVVAAIAEGRHVSTTEVRSWIDRMPMLPAEAVESGLADAVLYEDEISTYLAGSASNPVELVTFDQAAHWLRRRPPLPTPRVIGIVPIEGVIVTGHSRRLPIPVPLPFFDEQTAGAETVIQMLRRAEEEQRVTAVILYVDSPGGSALAADMIAREVRRLRERKPVVALFGEQATSGGYYVAAPAQHIVARPTTLTGSIGIWGGKFVLGELYRKAGVVHVPVQRGAMAGLYSDLAPFTENERAWLRRDLGEAYQRFKEVVAEGRRLSLDEVEALARGRVWTGAQAHQARLVDELGGYEAALRAAKRLAGFAPERYVAAWPILPPRVERPPIPFPLDRGEAFRAWSDMLQALASERVWALSPWMISLR